MSLSKEVKTGILVTAALGIFFIGFYFLKGASLFSNNKEYYTYYNSVDGLQNSANVMMRGLVIGHVSALKLDDKGVKVQLTVPNNIEIPEGTVVLLSSDGLLGGKVINLVLGTGPKMVEDGATLAADKEKGMLDGITGELNPRLVELKATIAHIDTVLLTINGVLAPIKTTAGNLAALTGTLNQQSGEITSIMHNLNSFTGNLSHQNDSIRQIIYNFNSVSRQLANAPIQKTVNELQGTVTQLKGVIEKMNSNQGSLGMLINNKDLYNNLNGAVNSIQKLTDDLKAHPSRYINVTIFGKKKS